MLQRYETRLNRLLLKELKLYYVYAGNLEHTKEVIRSRTIYQTSVEDHVVRAVLL